MNKLLFVLLAVCIAVGFAESNKKKILETIKAINTLQHFWKADYTPLSELNVHEMKMYLGAKPLPKNTKRKHIKVAQNIPSTFDSRTQWSQCPSISSIKDQGQCSGCWAVSTAAAASDRLCIGSSYSIQLNLSAENLLTCCSKCSDNDGGCNGGWPNLAWQYIRDSGIVTGGDYDSNEGCQPFSIEPTGVTTKEYTPPCETECTNSYYDTAYNDDLHYGDTAYTLDNNVQQIQTDMYNNGPTVACFGVYKDFQHYKTGVYVRTSDKFVGNHAVRMIGWGKDEDSGLDYWLIANSWNRTWGDNGLFKIRRGTDECGIEDQVSAGLISS